MMKSNLLIKKGSNILKKNRIIVKLGGNIGKPVLNLKLNDTPIVIIEASSSLSSESIFAT